MNWTVKQPQLDVILNALALSDLSPIEQAIQHMGNVSTMKIQPFNDGVNEDLDILGLCRSILIGRQVTMGDEFKLFGDVTETGFQLRIEFTKTADGIGPEAFYIQQEVLPPLSALLRTIYTINDSLENPFQSWKRPSYHYG